MKTNNSKFSILGFVLFLSPILVIVTISVTVFIFALKYFKIGIVILIMLVLVVIFTLLFCFFDVIRRRVMIDKPLKEILFATSEISKGNFDISLKPKHSYEKYDEYDLIIENFNKMGEELSKSEILKSDFISNVSHEIKTPLSVIQNYAKALKNKNLSEENGKLYLNSIINNCEKLTNLVTNILKLNKIENQSIKNIEKINIGELLRQVILNFENLFNDKNLNVDCDIEDIYILSETNYLEIIFNNLISNSIKFTENKGSIKIDLKVNKNFVEFKISDNGCGISNETGKHIFEKFYQGDTSHSFEGNGLGLALVKKIIDKIGGQIFVESEEGVGSTFIVKLKKDSYGKI